MRKLLPNFMLATIWTLMAGRITIADFALGFLLSFPIGWFAHGRGAPGPRHALRLGRAVGLLAFFVVELFLSTMRVAWDVITPTLYMRPGVIAVPLEARTDEEITTLANLVSLTPGSLSLDVSGEPRVLYVHAMYAQDEDEIRRQIREGFERRVLEVLR